MIDVYGKYPNVNATVHPGWILDLKLWSLECVIVAVLDNDRSFGADT